MTFNLKKYTKIYREFDEDKSGTIEKNEMKGFIKKLNEGLIEEDNDDD